MDGITVHEAREVLQRLIRERKAIERGLSVVDILSDIEANIINRQAILDGLIAKCDAKSAELVELDENVSEIHKRRNAACAQREDESRAILAKLSVEQANLDARFETLSREYESKQALLKSAYLQESTKCNTEINDLKSIINTLKIELSSLNAEARRLAGV